MNPTGFFRRLFDNNKHITLILIGSAILMSYGIWAVEPHIILPDEKAAVTKALWMGMNRTPFIPDFKKGGNLYLYLLAASFVPYYVYLKATGQIAILSAEASGLASFYDASDYFQDIFLNFLIVGRILSVAFGVATVWLVYVLARDVYNERTGRFAALLLGVTMGWVNIAHFATEDVIATFLVLLAVFYMNAALKSGSVREILLASGIAGLAISAKATTGILILPLGYLIWRTSSPAWYKLGRRLVGSFSVMTIAYILTTPSILVYPTLYIAELSSEIANQSGPVYSTQGGYLFQVLLIARSFSLPIFLLVILGVLFTVVRRINGRNKHITYAIGWFVIPYFLIVGSWSGVWYIIPLLPFLGIYGAVLLNHLSKNSHFGSFIIGICLIFGLLYTGFTVNQFTTDARAETTQWASENIEGQVEIDIYAQRIYQPEFPPNADVNRLNFKDRGDQNWEKARDRIRCQKPDYVVLMSTHYKKYLRDPDTYPIINDFYEKLINGNRGYRKTQQFGPSIKVQRTTADLLLMTVKPRKLGRYPTVLILERDGPPKRSC